MSAARLRLRVVSVVPSPYQRDLFRALACEPGIELAVHYQERAAPDSPWPEEPLAPWENVLPGWTLGRGRVRCHWNWGLPEPQPGEKWIVNVALTSAFGQWLMRQGLARVSWYFWGERMAPRPSRSLGGLAQNALLAPVACADGVAAVGQQARDDYAQRLPGIIAHNVPYCSNLRPFYEIERGTIPAKEIRFLFCGQMIARKGLDVLLHAFDLLIRSGRAARLTLVGREDPAAAAWLGAMGKEARSRVVVVGFVAPRELAGHFGCADVFVLPSRRDGWGVVVAQAAASGLPLICSEEVGAADELIAMGGAGLRVPAGDAQALAGAMAYFVEQPHQGVKMGQAARAGSLAYTEDAGVRRWMEILR